MRRDAYALAIAEAADRLFRRGICDPSAEEIAREHFRDILYSPVVVEDIKKRLPTIRRILDDPNGDYDRTVCLLSEQHYLTSRNGDTFIPSNRDRRPTTEHDARRSLPGGGRKPRREGDSNPRRAVGLWFSKDKNDLIIQAAINQEFLVGGGVVRKNIRRVIQAHADQRISDEQATDMIRNAENTTSLDGATFHRKVDKASRHATPGSRPVLLPRRVLPQSMPQPVMPRPVTRRPVEEPVN